MDNVSISILRSIITKVDKIPELKYEVEVLEKYKNRSHLYMGENETTIAIEPCFSDSERVVIKNKLTVEMADLLIKQLNTEICKLEIEINQLEKELVKSFI